MRTMTGSITLPRVPLRFIVVAAAHVGLFYVVNDALRFELKAESKPPLEVIPIVEDPVAVRKPDPTQPPIVDKWFPLSPPKPPDPRFEDPSEEVAEPIPPQPTDGLSEGGRPTGEIVARFIPVRAHAIYPLTRAPYPPGAIRDEEEGVVELAIYVLRNGRITDVRVAMSSGYPRLDRAAVEEARRHWRLQPAMQGDTSVDAWGSFRVVFRLDR